jgi:hypothetical protein
VFEFDRRVSVTGFLVHRLLYESCVFVWESTIIYGVGYALIGVINVGDSSFSSSGGFWDRWGTLMY